MRMRTLALLLSALVLASCGARKPVYESLPVSIFQRGDSGSTANGQPVATQTVISDQSTFDAAWADLQQGTSPAGIDFENVHIVFVQRMYNSGGWDLQPLSIEDHGDGTIDLELSVSGPGADCMSTQALTHPWLMLSVPQTITAVDVTEKSITRVGC